MTLSLLIRWNFTLLLSLGLSMPPALLAGSNKKSGAAGKHPSRKLLDLNHASRSELIGAGFSGFQADKIAEGRPWRRKGQILAQDIVTDFEYEILKKKITVEQGKPRSGAAGLDPRSPARGQ